MIHWLCDFHLQTGYAYRGVSANTCINIGDCVWVIITIKKPTKFDSDLRGHTNAAEWIGLFHKSIIPVYVILIVDGRFLAYF